MALLFALLWPVPARAAFPGRDRRIAFERLDGDYDIWTISAHAQVPRNLTHDGKKERAPAWSADGTKIAFHSNATGIDEVWTMNADGSGRTQVTTIGGRRPAWSPDGTQIAFTHDGDIWVIDAAGTNATQLTTDPATDDEASWSPDGTKIAFVSNRDGDRDIFTMDPSGANQTNITNNGATDSDPDWSPDGSRIAFSSGGRIEITVPNGTNHHKLTPGADPAWSPDGKELFFVRGSPKTIYKVLLFNRHVTVFTRGAAPAEQPRP